MPSPYMDPVHRPWRLGESDCVELRQDMEQGESSIQKET